MAQTPENCRYRGDGESIQAGQHREYRRFLGQLVRRWWIDTCQRACRKFAKLKTPWAFAWDKHNEAIDYNRMHASLEKAIKIYDAIQQFL